MAEMRNITLPENLCGEAERRFASRFGTLEELLGMVLRELLRDDAVQMDEAEQQIIEERLRNLGYV
jgi:hypothetical protein